MKHQLKDGRYLMASWQDIHDFFIEHGIVGKTITEIIPKYYDFRCGNLDAIDRVYALNEYSNIITDGQICIVFSDETHLELFFLGDGPVLLGYNTADFTTYSKYDGENYNIQTLFQDSFGRTITDIYFEKSDTPMKFPVYYGERSFADDDGIDMSEDDDGIKYIDFLLDDGTRLRGEGSFDEFGFAHLDAEGKFLQKVPYQQLFNEMKLETLEEIYRDEPEILSIIKANRFSN